MWVYGADSQWHEVAGGSSGGGSSGGGLVVHWVDIDDNMFRLDKTWQEIYDAMASGKNCVIADDEYQSATTIQSVRSDGSSASYPFEVIDADITKYITDSADKYPTYHMD